MRRLWDRHAHRNGHWPGHDSRLAPIRYKNGLPDWKIRQTWPVQGKAISSWRSADFGRDAERRVQVSLGVGLGHVDVAMSEDDLCRIEACWRIRVAPECRSRFGDHGSIPARSHAVRIAAP
jgi:hypothetical protein